MLIRRDEIISAMLLDDYVWSIDAVSGCSAVDSLHLSLQFPFAKLDLLRPGCGERSTCNWVELEICWRRRDMSVAVFDL